MSFLNPFFLIGSIMLAVPILIHLVRREKSEIVPFSSLMFLLKVPKRSIRQQILKNMLLMLLRILILALLVGAFARPYFTQTATPDAVLGQQRTVVMLLDNSYSMRYGTSFDRLKSEAGQRIDALGGTDRMALIAFNDTATVLAMPTPDKNQLKALVSTLEPSYAGTRYYEAFNLADRVLGQVSGEKQLVMISDFQRVGWNRSGRESIIGNEVKTEMVSVGVEQSMNVGIDSVSVDQTTFNRTYSGRVTARIHNYRKDEAVTVPVSLRINDKEVSRRDVTVSINSTALAEFTGFDLNLGFSKGSVRIEREDPLTVDNEFLFTLERREKLSLLIMDAGRPLQSTYLAEVYSSSTSLPFSVAVKPAQNVTAEELGSHAVVIINDVPRLTDRVRDRLNELRKTGQGQFVILATNADLTWWADFNGIPAKPTQKIYVSKDRGRPSVAVTTVNRNHGIFKPFLNSAAFSLNSAQFLAYTELELKPESSALAKFENGAPLLVEGAGENAGLLVYASTVDDPGRSWNDLPLKPSFVSFFHEAARYLSRYNEVRDWYSLGEGIPVVGGRETSAAAVIKPDGERQSLGDLGPGEQRYFAPIVPGFHELRVGRDVRVIAANSPANEGNLERMPTEDLLASVQRTEGETRQAGLFTDDEEADYAKRQLGWWYLLLIALLAGIAEIYVANRSQKAQAELRRP